MSDSADTSRPATTPYRVLARKYRPQNFAQLKGQDALVRTLTNAINSGRIAQAYMLTGVRGVGKTTTARIIAKALNYTGPDGKAGPTTGPTDDCATCRAIAEDRHPDVMEMDAASRTGVDDIRELIDGVRYAPTSARYKVYIIDEVHMLSKNAFNALLKTLEEPPPHVIFIFATTEIRKVPVTVLSRCQRFDLRRLDIPTLTAHYKWVCGQEQVEIEDEALALIARAADGSARDGMSILDQAIALADGPVTGSQIKDMLGLADRGQVLDVFEHALKGQCPQALEIAQDLYAKGADPLQIAEDMLDCAHLMTRLKAAPKAGGLQAVAAQDTIDRAMGLAGQMSMPSLGRAWQLLLKGMAEVRDAPNPHSALEMLLIRLAYAADLPDPGELVRKLKTMPAPSGVSAAAFPATPARAPEPVAMRRVANGGYDSPGEAAQAVAAEPSYAPMESLRTLHDVHALAEQAREMILAGQIFYQVHPVRMEPGRIELRLADTADQGLPQAIRNFLIKQTGQQWIVAVSNAAGQPTMGEIEAQQDAGLRERAEAHPIVRSVMDAFPGTKLKIIKTEPS